MNHNWPVNKFLVWFSDQSKCVIVIHLTRLCTCCSPRSLGKLEEEFEKKFNSLPQYSPLTFDKKSTGVAKKKKIDSGTVPEESQKNGKGEQRILPQCFFSVRFLFIFYCRNRSFQSFPIISLTNRNRISHDIVLSQDIVSI